MAAAAAPPPVAPALLALAVAPPEEALASIQAVALLVLETGEVAFNDSGKAVVLVDGALRQPARRRSLTVQSPALVKALHLLAIAHRHLIQGETCTVRELYYRNKITAAGGSIEAFPNEQQCNYAIKTSGLIVGLSRDSLGLCGADKGSFTGAVRWRTSPQEAWRSASDSVYIVPSLHAYLELSFEPEMAQRARCVLVVEKHTVFHRIVAGQLTRRLPCVVVTGRGFPDMATRRLVLSLREQLGVPVLGLADYNPFGLAILLVYAHGSVSMGDSYHFATPSLRPIGLFHDDAVSPLLGAPEAAFQDWTAADETKANALLRSPAVMARTSLRAELQQMMTHRKKLELDVLSAHRLGALVDVWLPTVMQRGVVDDDFA